MLEHVIPHLTEQRQIIEQQKVDGAVSRPEFDPDYDVSGWPLLSDPERRSKLERYVLRKCIPERHRFKMADGSNGVVYFDSRDRAVHCSITEVPDADLVRLAQEAGKRLPGKKDPKKPKTGRRDHGYTPPMQEETLDEAMKLPLNRFKSAADQMENISKTMKNMLGRVNRDGEEKVKERMLEEFQRALSLSKGMITAAKHLG
jgi:hypothetical protein